MTRPRAAGTTVAYRCKTCGKRVAVVLGEGGPMVIRACAHADAGVTADLTATVYSESKLS